MSIKMLVLSLTGQCNFACRYCYAAEHERSMMSPETALAAVKLAADGGERFVIQFSGGEPLLNFDCLKAVVDYVHKEKLPAVLQLQTNGSLLTDKIAKYLYKNKVAIGVSLDGRPAVNDKLRLKKNGYGATGEILKGIEVLRRNNIARGVTCVVTSENVDTLYQFAARYTFTGLDSLLDCNLVQFRILEFKEFFRNIADALCVKLYRFAFAEAHGHFGSLKLFTVQITSQKTSKAFRFGLGCLFTFCESVLLRFQSFCIRQQVFIPAAQVLNLLVALHFQSCDASRSMISPLSVSTTRLSSNLTQAASFSSISNGFTLCLL